MEKTRFFFLPKKNSYFSIQMLKTSSNHKASVTESQHFYPPPKKKNKESLNISCSFTPQTDTHQLRIIFCFSYERL